MRRPSRILLRLAITVFALLLLLVVALMLLPDPASNQPQLPFDTNGYFVTHGLDLFPSHLPPHASLGTRLQFGYFKVWQIIHPYPDPTNTTFAGVPVGPQGIETSLNACTQASGIRYFMPPELAIGVVTFGISNGGNGRQWITSCENALQTGMPSIREPHTGHMVPQNLVLIRYPKQRAVLILTTNGAAEFRRTNNTGVIDKPAP